MASINNSDILLIDINKDGVLTYDSANSARYGSGNTIPLYRTDKLLVVDSGNDYYYILEYNTAYEFGKNNLSSGKNIAGRYIRKSNTSSVSITDTNYRMNMGSLNIKGNPTISTTSLGDAWTQSINASYGTWMISSNKKSPKQQLNDSRTTLQEMRIQTINSATGEYRLNGNNESYTITTALESSTTGADSSLRIQTLQSIWGIPNQFLPITDLRLSDKPTNDNDALGRVYANNLIKNLPLLLITPGDAEFNKSNSEGNARATANAIGQQITGERAFNKSYRGKYYKFIDKYTDYFHYVNVMLRLAARFLGIGDEKFKNEYLKDLNWGTVNFTAESTTGASKWLHKIMSKYIKDTISNTIAFYANCGESVSDSFGNATTTSQLASAVNSLSDKTRELTFLGLNNDMRKAATGIDARELGGTITSGVQNILPDSFKGGFVDSVLASIKTIVAGGRLIFPNIWQDSQFSRSYPVSMKLVSPSADKLSIFFNILVPMFHILALALPRQHQSSDNDVYGDQGYTSPFLVRAYYKGMFNIDMGIISNLSITKGTEGEWSRDGLPTVMNIDFSIEDLYQRQMMSTNKGDLLAANILSNIAELDYIANSCGININADENARALRLWQGATTTVSDLYSLSVIGALSQSINNAVNGIFSWF